MNGHRNHRDTRLGCSREGPYSKREQAGHAGKGPFRKKGEGAAGFGMRCQSAGILCPLFGIKPLNKLGIDTLHKEAIDPAAAQLSLGHKAERFWQGGHQHQAIEITGVVGHDNEGAPMRQLLQPLNPERGPGQPSQ